MRWHVAYQEPLVFYVGLWWARSKYKIFADSMLWGWFGLWDWSHPWNLPGPTDILISIIVWNSYTHRYIYIYTIYMYPVHDPNAGNYSIHSLFGLQLVEECGLARLHFFNTWSFARVPHQGACVVPWHGGVHARFAGGATCSETIYIYSTYRWHADPKFGSLYGPYIKGHLGVPVPSTLQPL